MCVRNRVNVFIENHPMEWTDVLWYLLVSVGGLVVGYAFGSRRARKIKKRALRQMNAQSLELLDVKASLNAQKQSASQQLRKDKVLKLALRKLKLADLQSAKLDTLLMRQNKKHYIDIAKLKLKAVKANEKAVGATAIARKATVHLKRLEQASPITQTIEAPEPKSYGSGDPVTVSVVDQARLDSACDAPSAVSNRDSDRLSKLRSSNEAIAQAQS